MENVYKFGTLVAGEERSYEYPDIYSLEKTSGPDRLVVAPRGRQISLILKLLKLMAPPFGLLYVLAVPRTTGRAGRYQVSEPVSYSETEQFLMTFSEFLERDARHHLWLASVAGSDLLVYDNHNVIYAYGKISEFEKIVADWGVSKTKSVPFPSPHTHKYNPIFDQDEQGVLGYWTWKWSPLQKHDE